jgi:hypothetical protein
MLRDAAPGRCSSKAVPIRAAKASRSATKSAHTMNRLPDHVDLLIRRAHGSSSAAASP